MKSNYIVVFVACLLLFPQFVYSQDSTYSTPHRLFHVERSKNKNIVCYDINLESNGNWNSSEPVKIYWVNREEKPGETNGLSGIQKKLAYGYKLHSHNGDSCIISLNACSDRKITIKKKGQSFCCMMTINNKLAQLNKVYVQAGKHNSLKVEYVELSGTSTETNKPITERITD